MSRREDIEYVRGRVGEAEFNADWVPKRYRDPIDMLEQYDANMRIAKGESKEGRQAPPTSSSASREWVHQQLEDTCRNIGEFLAKELNPLSARLKALEERPAALDYKGIYRPGRGYRKNEGVSHKSSIWVALTDHPSGTPGDEKSGWQLAEKEWKK